MKKRKIAFIEYVFVVTQRVSVNNLIIADVPNTTHFGSYKV